PAAGAPPTKKPINHSRMATISTYHSTCAAKPRPPNRAKMSTRAIRAIIGLLQLTAVRTALPGARDLPALLAPESSHWPQPGDAAVYFFFGLTLCLRLAPAVNFGALEALIFTFSPVRGFTPTRAARLTTENLSKPVMATSSPFFRVLLMTRT